MGVLTPAAYTLPRFDLQAHRGGAGLAPENSLAACGAALDLGVSTLECDVHVTADGVPVLTHERTWAGHFVPVTPLADLRDEAGTPIATLADVVDLLRERQAHDVGLNVETKFDVLHREEQAPREQFVAAVLAVVDAADLTGRASVQSFDWAVLRLVRASAPGLRLNALVNTGYLEVDQPGASPWLAGLDIDDFHDSPVQAAAHLGFDALSPSHTILTPALVAEAHESGLRVLPYTVDDSGSMRRLVALGVDGLITNRPDVLREVLAGLDVPLPPAHPRLA